MDQNTTDWFSRFCFPCQRLHKWEINVYIRLFLDKIWESHQIGALLFKALRVERSHLALPLSQSSIITRRSIICTIFKVTVYVSGIKIDVVAIQN